MPGGLVKGSYAPPTCSSISSNWGKTALHHHTVKPHWFSIYSQLCSWKSVEQQLQRRSGSQNASAPPGAATFRRSDAPDCKAPVLRGSSYMHAPSVILLTVHVQGSDSCYRRSQDTKMAEAGDHLPCWRVGRGGSDSLQHPSQLWFITVFVWAKGCCP